MRTWFWDALRLGFWFETQGFSFWECFFSALRASGLVQLHFREPRASGLWLLLLVSFHSLFLDSSFSFMFIWWHQGERQAPPGLRASALLSHLSSSRRRLVERWGMTRSSSVQLKTISATSKNLPRGKSSQGEVSISPDFSTSGLRGYSDGWDDCQLWRFMSWFSRLWCRLFIPGRPIGLEDPYYPLWEELRSDWVPRVFTAFSTSLQLDSECMRPRRSPLCRDLSLERLFRDCANSSMPREWANHWHIA